MKQQVFIIHGGNAFNSYDDYLTDLKQKEVSLEMLKLSDWKSSLGAVLGEMFEVLIPRMPNPQNAKYFEWKIFFEKYIPLLDDGVILIGHSLGGIFLAKYLSEEIYPKKIRATLLVAAPFNTPHVHPYVDFNLLNSLEGLAAQGGAVFFYHSKDDQVVPFSDFENYRVALPGAQFRTFEDRQHFNGEAFPEIAEDIRKSR